MRPLRSFAAAALVPAALTIALALTAAPAAAASITVNTVSDFDTTDGFCSIREAILAANTDAAHNECTAGSGDDHIHFAFPLPGIILLTDHLPAITETLAIHGPATGSLTLDGDTSYRAITVEFPSTGIWLLVQDLKLVNGRTRIGDFGGGGAFLDGGVTALFERVVFRDNHSENSGGGVMVGSGTGNESHVLLRECLFRENTAEGPAGGGGLATTGTGSVVDVVRSAFVSNEALNSAGGAISGGRGFITIDASTISGNRAKSIGGGIYSSTAPQGGAALLIRDSTITDNTAGVGGVSGDGGGLSLSPGTTNPLTASLENTIVAGNFDLVGGDEPDVSCNIAFVAFAATGSNLIGANDGCATLLPVGSPNPNGDFVGTVAAPIDPRLEALADHGGPTPTHRPTINPLSPLIDQGTCPGAVTDQRLYGWLATGLRINDINQVPNAAGGDGCDIGAFERAGSPLFADLIFADGFESGNVLRWHDHVQK